MKLSELILKGCEMVPTQGFGSLMEFPGLDDPSHVGWPVKKVQKGVQITKACVWGTAAIGYLGMPSVGESMCDYMMKAQRTVNMLAAENEILAKIDEQFGASVNGSLVHMNDIQKMTREEIAAKIAKKGH